MARQVVHNMTDDLSVIHILVIPMLGIGATYLYILHVLNTRNSPVFLFNNFLAIDNYRNFIKILSQEKNIYLKNKFKLVLLIHFVCFFIAIAVPPPID